MRDTKKYFYRQHSLIKKKIRKNGSKKLLVSFFIGIFGGLIGGIIYLCYISHKSNEEIAKYKSEMINAENASRVHIRKFNVASDQIFSEENCIENNFCFAKEFNKCSKLSNKFSSKEIEYKASKLVFNENMCALSPSFCGYKGKVSLELFNELKKDGSERLKCFLKLQEEGVKNRIGT